MSLSEESIGKDLFAYIKSQDRGLNIFKVSTIKNQLLKFSISNPKLQRELFRFVDVLPVLKSSKQITQYLFEYLTNSEPKLLINNPVVNKFCELGVKLGTKILGSSFICGTDINEALRKIQKLKEQGQEYTLDPLGELVLSEREATEHYQQYLKIIQEIPELNLSIKLSSLISQINPLDYSGREKILKERLRNIYREAQRQNSFINIDTETYAWKDFTYEIIQELLIEDEFKNWTNAGIVLQAYLKESKEDLKSWINWAKKRSTPITIRLVKGAYWDYEYAISQQQNWELPVFREKQESDINFEELTKILLDNHRYIRPAIASHNIRSLAHALSYIQANRIDKSKFEFQMLYGMMDSLKTYFAENGYTIRVYMPYGELIPGMAYLVRRLLENTANDSFLRQGLLEDRDIDELLRNPKEIESQLIENKINSNNWVDNFINDAPLNFAQKINREKMQEAIKLYSKEFQNIEIPHSDINDCEEAVKVAEEAHKYWSSLKQEQRSEVLKLTAKKLKKNRYKFNALLCLEAFKPWQEADPEVSEAIDFLEYYADQALAMQTNELRSLNGEKNTNRYLSYGVAVIISPWNFPLAIMSGMTVAALVTGNSVIVKPSQQSPIIAWEFLKLLKASIKEVIGKEIPGLVNFIHGEGKVLGLHLVSNPKTRLIAFTGSNAVGMGIHDIASKARPAKKVIAEMGGKNAIIIDDSADIEEAISGVINSAFGYAGQKCSACSRLIIHQSIYQEFTSRLIEAVKTINISDPSSESCFLPPVIDQKAKEKIMNYVGLGKKDGTLLLGDLPIPDEGNYISPYIFADLNPDHKLAQEEIFGPVLLVFQANDLDHALEIANNSNFGLTGAFYSRSPKNIQKVSEEFAVGNLYINRGSTGAVVSRQAFGGLKQSSIGFKAGGPNYLLQFVQEKTITENTMRKGFVAD